MDGGSLYGNTLPELPLPLPTSSLFLPPPILDLNLELRPPASHFPLRTTKEEPPDSGDLRLFPALLTPKQEPRDGNEIHIWNGLQIAPFVPVEEHYLGSVFSGGIGCFFDMAAQQPEIPMGVSGVRDENPMVDALQIAPSVPADDENLRSEFSWSMDRSSEMTLLPKEEPPDGNKNPTTNGLQIASFVPPEDEYLLSEFPRRRNRFNGMTVFPKEEPRDGNVNPTANGLQVAPFVATDDDHLRSEFARRLSRFSDMTVLQPDLQSAVVPAVRPPRRRGGVIVPSEGPSGALGCWNSVRKARVLYESIRLFFIRDEACVDPPDKDCFARSRRPDLKAGSVMTGLGLSLNRGHRFVGSVPGIEIGDLFFFRMEMCVVGLHCQVQAGIDYIPPGRSLIGEPIATSVVASGGYEDDEDGGDVLIYTGHGGRVHRVSQKHVVHQKLERGNLALERSMRYGIEIRVIRGFACVDSPSGRVYIYDGLYRIHNTWLDVGKSGFGVYKYRLVRTPHQAEMGSSMFKLAANLKQNPNCRRGFVYLDISNGKERVPVRLFNDLDSDRGPMSYNYIANPIFPPYACWVASVGCDCVSGCSGGCACLRRNGGDFAFDRQGILARGRPLIYECGRLCKCPPSCRNRVSQNGVKLRLEVFRSREFSWGARSLDLIKAGSFVCELAGVVVTQNQGVILSMNGDKLIYAAQFPHRWTDWGNISGVFPESMQLDIPGPGQLDFGIDISRMRNVGCYINHSSVPNLMVQYVLYDHDNVSYPHLMLFALENIPPMRELTIDYGLDNGWSRNFVT